MEGLFLLLDVITRERGDVLVAIKAKRTHSSKSALSAGANIVHIPAMRRCLDSHQRGRRGRGTGRRGGGDEGWDNAI